MKTPITLGLNNLDNHGPEPVNPIRMVRTPEITTPMTRLPPNSVSRIPRADAVVTKVKITPHQRPDCPSIIPLPCPYLACKIQAIPVTINESWSRETTFSAGNSKAAPTVMGMTIILVKIKKSHCRPDIQLYAFNNSFIKYLTCL